MKEQQKILPFADPIIDVYKIKGLKESNIGKILYR